MTAYLIKTILCSVAFLGFYLWFLEKEKMFRFNRFYLVGSLMISILIPLIEIETKSEIFPKQFVENIEIINEKEPINENTFGLEIVEKKADYWSKENILWAIYGFISLIFIIRFTRNLRAIYFEKRKSQSTDFQGIKIVLTEKKQLPHSFFDTIFLNKNEFQNQKIETEIIEHEIAHIRQKHSLDILFFEIFFAIFWLNPFLYFYGKAIRLNHEFLADEAVLKRFQNLPKYQFLLLNEIVFNQQMRLSSHFNYLFTKKRFKMMNKQFNKQKVMLLQIAILPFSMIVFLLFGKIGFAQQPKTERKTAIHSQNDASQSIEDEYKQILKKYVIPNKSVHLPNETDRARLEVLFKSMSKEQQNKQEYVMQPPFPPFAKSSPKESEFEAFKNGKIYGVWLDGKKIQNTILDQYQASDISHVFVSKLYPNAQKTIGYKYKFQVDLMTNAHYEKYRKERLADKKYYLRPDWFRKIKK